MEDFLSTLPNYVHTYLNKRPATETFHLLRELICFAVLYSNDRDIITARTQSLLAKDTHEVSQPLNVARLPGLTHAQQIPSKSTDSIPSADTAVNKEPDDESADKKEKEEQVVPRCETASETSTELSSTTADSPSRMPNTFPKWWGHDDGSVPETKSLCPTPTKPTSSAAWIPWQESKEREPAARRRTSTLRAIPDLRSYLDSPGMPRTTGTADASRRQSATAAASSRAPPPSTMSVAITRSASAYRPGQTATVRARAEQAKARQQRLEEEKAKQMRQASARPTLTSTNRDTLKKERRKTMPITGTSNFHTTNKGVK